MQELIEIISKQIASTKDSVRLFHGRGKKWPKYAHFSIDFFPPNILITTYKDISLDEKNALVKLLHEIPELNFESIFLQKRFNKNEEVEVLWGEFPVEAFAVEKAEKYILNLKKSQNIGFFLDMAIGRELVRKLSANRRVLNLFSYTCSLSVAALKGGAIEVVNIDMSKPSLAIGEKNHQLNELSGRAKFIPYDVLSSFPNIKRRGPYDLVIIDPPTNQGESFKALRDYYKVIKRLDEMTEDEAFVLACLNSPYLNDTFIQDIFKEYAPNFIMLEKHYSSFSHMEINPEEGLKIFLYKKI